MRRPSGPERQLLAVRPEQAGTRGQQQGCTGSYSGVRRAAFAGSDATLAWCISVVRGDDDGLHLSFLFLGSTTSRTLSTRLKCASGKCSGPSFNRAAGAQSCGRTRSIYYVDLTVRWATGE
jgi:hypothetical protein